MPLHDPAALGLSLPLLSVAPFAGLLLSIALLPLVAPALWARHYAKACLAFGLPVAGFFLLRAPGEYVGTVTARNPGDTLAGPLRETGVFPGMVTQMIGVGEQTGAMDAMLQKIADFYEDEVDAAVKDLLSALEPAMIVFLGVVVGGIVISMYMPLFTLIGQLSSAH